VTTITNRDEYERWQLETKLVEAELERLERSERAILTSLKCPHEFVPIYAILTGEQRPPWPKRMARRDKTRALHAMHALAQIAKTRQYLALGQENARLAVHAALMAGELADDAAVKAAVAAQVTEARRKAGKKTSARIAQVARQHDDDIKKHARQWRMSEMLQVEYTTAGTYIRAKTHLPARTIQRALKRLRTSNRDSS
jgi:hypothetical protein